MFLSYSCKPKLRFKSSIWPKMVQWAAKTVKMRPRQCPIFFSVTQCGAQSLLATLGPFLLGLEPLLNDFVPLLTEKCPKKPVVNLLAITWTTCERGVRKGPFAAKWCERGVRKGVLSHCERGVRKEIVCERHPLSHTLSHQVFPSKK